MGQDKMTPIIYAPRAGEFNASHARGLLANESRLGLDTEGQGLRDKSPNQFEWGLEGLRLVQFGTETAAVVLDMQSPEQRAFAEEILNQDRVFVAHNARHEIISLQCALGIDISPKIYDTYLVSQLLDPGPIPSGRHGLKPLTQAYLDDGLAEAQQALYDRFKEIWPGKRGAPWSEVSQHGWDNIPSHDETYTRYAGLDAIYVRRLAPILATEAHAKGVYDAIPREQRISRLSAQLSVAGWRVDGLKLGGLLDDYGVRHTAAREKFKKAYGMPLGSPKRVEWLQKRGVVIEAHTIKGSPSLAAEEVKRLVAMHPDGEVGEFLALVLEAAQTQNIFTFGSSLQQFTDADSRVHAQINTLHAVTGRMSVTSPALQTVSWHSPIRECFTTDSPDHVLVSADFSQIEPRVFAVYAEEHGLAEEVKEGVDVYSAVAQQVGNRKVAKRVLLGRAYGAGVRTMTTQIQMLDGLPISPDEVRAALETVDRAYPGFKTLSKRLEKLDEVRLESGRSIPVDHKRRYKNVNSLVQGTARDLFVDAMLRIQDAGIGHMMRMWIHDEVILSVPKAELHEVLPMLNKCMTVPFKWMPVDSEIEVYSGGWMEGKEVWRP